MRKQFFLIVDTETTIKQHVADFGAVVTCKKGIIHNQCGVLTKEYFLNENLFFDNNSIQEIWTKLGLEKRLNSYEKMLNDGTRIIASTNAINKWLEQAKEKYNPELTAYNLAFDIDKCNKSNIDLNIFENQFCLWYLSANKYANTRKYLTFILNNHYFNNPTARHNMSYKTNAEVMARFCTGKMLPDEPHTALEDILYYELPILLKIINTKNWREKIKKYYWENYQVKDNFQPKPYNPKNKDLLNDD